MKYKARNKSQIVSKPDSLSMLRNSSRSGFTLLELLIVIGILAILGTVIIWILNPLEYNRQARDSNRITDLMATRGALDFVEFEGKSLGTSTVVYVSIPSSLPDCSDLGLPALYPGWTYSCAPLANYRKVDGTGWIPVNFTKLSTGSPISKLPIDPINTTSTGLYYAYVTGPSYKLTALFESEKLAPYMNKDGGPDPTLYEIGSTSRLNLANFHRGMVAYWNYDGNARDSSGYGSDGTLCQRNGSPACPSVNGPSVSSGKVAGAYNFDGVDDFIDLADPASLRFGYQTSSSSLSIAVWVKLSVIPVVLPWRGLDIIDSSGLQEYGNKSWALDACTDCNGWRVFISGDAQPYLSARLSASAYTTNWTFIVATYDARAKTINMFVNGNLDNGELWGSVPDILHDWVASGPDIGNRPAELGTTENHFPGLIDDLRVYNHALSATEINAMYNATK